MSYSSGFRLLLKIVGLTGTESVPLKLQQVQVNERVKFGDC
jgi:hypothetical protein